MDNYAALKRQTTAFATMEATYGTFVMPVATDALRVTEVPSVSQEKQFSDVGEIANTRSQQGRTNDGYAAGSFSVAVNARPSGAAGTAPEEDVLQEAAWGSKAIDAGVSVTYSPAIELPSFSLVVQEHHTTHFCAGCKVDTLSTSVQKKGSVTLSFGGHFKSVVRAGTAATVAASTDTIIKLEAGGALLFQPGAYVQIADDDHAGAGYLIASVDEAADTITLSTAATGGAPAADATVTGFIPTVTYSGYTVDGSSGTVTLDGASLTMVSGQLELSNGNTPDEEEIGSGGYITDVDEGQRIIKATLECRFRRQYTAFFSRAHSQSPGALVINAGATAGKQFAQNLPQAEFDTPKPGGGDTKRNITVSGQGMPTGANENEASVVYS